MGFLDKIRDFKNHISEVESSIHENKQDFLEIYEKNVQLEKEISARTQELNVTNRRMLTLQHIWDMMNASKPLSNVFTSIVKTLQGDLGYLHCAIIKIENENGEKKLRILNQSTDVISEKIEKLFGEPSMDLALSYPKDGIFLKSLEENVILQTVDLRGALRTVMPDMSEDLFRSLLSNPQSRSLISISLETKEQRFGWLVVFSERDSAEDAEINFLRLFAQQIQLAITIADLFQMVKNQAVTDALTTLYNRRYFEEYLQNEVTRAQRMKQPFTVIGLDLDHLKLINDKFGHSVGDIAIKTISDVLKKNARSIDVAARMGGEEFNILLPGIDSKGGMIAAERIRSAIESCDVEQVGHITASIGVGTYFEHTENVEELLELVDQAMYRAKKNGRNQVQLAKATSEISWQDVAIDTFVEILSRHKVPVSKRLSDSLCKKLSDNDKTTTKENLYSVSDKLAQTYNPNHKTGLTKEKVQLATKLAKDFELSEDEINKLNIATTLYDVGNLLLPHELLQKSEPLTEEEKEKIKEHPLIAAREILKPISQIQDVIPIIENHHENWDGSGYPNKIQGKEIPITSQIILIVDAYYALVEPRSYRPQKTSEEALKIIESDSNKKWNPELVKEFIKIVGKGKITKTPSKTD